jgi:hypothetical protein
VSENPKPAPLLQPNTIGAVRVFSASVLKTLPRLP